MSDLKIIGNPNPVVGVEEFYSISDFFYQTFSNEILDNINNPVEQQVQWEVYVLENHKWRKTKENDKRGNKISYTFFEKSLTRNGIRILAKKGDRVGRLDIKTLSAKPKIDHIELLDKNGSTIKQHLSYGQTIKARVFCLNMEKRRVNVTLWEDDAKGPGHNKANKKNFIETRSGIVNLGKADVDFLLKPSFAKIALRGRPEDDKIHEYYVTADYNNGKVASNNVNVDAPDETPVAPFKAKTTPKPVSKAPTQKAKTTEPVSKAPIATPAPKAKINSVNITDTNGHAIKGTFKEKQIKVWINSTGLKGKEVRLKLYDDDTFSNDLLLTQNFTLQSDLHVIVVLLSTIPRSLGGNYWSEGNEQELFAEVEVLQNHDFTKSAVVNVDPTVFKQDPIEATNKVLKVDGNDTKKNNEEACPRCETLTADEMTKIFTGASASDKNTLRNAFNNANKKFGLNTCQQKAHFFAQIMEEVGLNINIKGGEVLNYLAEDLPIHFFQI